MMILSYELQDDPYTEHEVYVTDIDAARAYLQSAVIPHMVLWASLTHASGIVVAETGDLV